MLKNCFIIAVKSKNSSYFIENILTLSESSQCYFAELLRPHCPNSPYSPNHNPENDCELG